MDAKMKAGLLKMREGIDLMLESEADVMTAPAAKKVSKPVENHAPVDGGDVTREELDGMTYNELKKYAKSRGVSAVGSREELTEKLLGGEQEAPVEKKKSAAPAPKNKKPTAIPDPTEEEADDDEGDDLADKVREAVAELSNEEIADLLVSSKIPAKGNREKMIEKVIEGVRSGKIDFDADGDDEEDDEVEEVEAPEVEDVTEEEDEVELQEMDFNDPSEMTAKRKKATVAFEKETTEAFENGELERNDLIAWLNEYHGTSDKMTKRSDDDILEEYIGFGKLCIDDDGDTVEEGAYMVNEIPFCCGRPLNEADGDYICETCGSTYESE